MSTITTVPRPRITPSMEPLIPAEERGVMRGASWNFYDRLTDAISERLSVRIAFDGKDVEIMVVGPVHEGHEGRLGIFVGEVCEGLDLDFHGLGSTTWKRQELERGIEADLCAPRRSLSGCSRGSPQCGRPGNGPFGSGPASSYDPGPGYNSRSSSCSTRRRRRISA